MLVYSTAKSVVVGREDITVDISFDLDNEEAQEHPMAKTLASIHLAREWPWVQGGAKRLFLFKGETWTASTKPVVWKRTPNAPAESDWTASSARSPRNGLR